LLERRLILAAEPTDPRRTGRFYPNRGSVAIAIRFGSDSIPIDDRPAENHDKEVAGRRWDQAGAWTLRAFVRSFTVNEASEAAMGNNTETSTPAGVRGASWRAAITRRRLAGLLLALALLLAACGGDDDGDEADTGGDAEESAEDAGEEEADAAAGPDVEIVFGHPFPDEHHLVVNVLQPWMDDVTEATGGTVTFDVQPGGALTTPQDGYTHPVDGVTDLSWGIQGYTPGVFPVTEVVELPFMFESGVQGTEALWDLYEEFDALQEEYAETHLLGIWTHDVGDLYTTSTPVETAEDVAGLDIRTPGPMQNVLVESLDASAVALPAPELYDALDRGVVDGLLMGHSGIPTFGLEEVLRHVTRGNFFVGPQFLVMNQATYDSLSPEQQAVLEETAYRTLSVALSEDMDRVGDEAVAQYEDWGFEVHELDDAALEEWRTATEDVPERWIDAQEDDVPAQEMYDRVLEIAGQG
jgi:TRAP-type C4-dicarboxylate transport system substrate-binding protein